MKLIDKGALDTLIKGIAARGKKLDMDIHIAACSAAKIREEHGDTGFINRLYLALPAGARKQAMTSWMLKYAGVIAAVGPSKDVQPFQHSKDAPLNVEAGMADPWYDHKPDPKPDEVIDVQALLQACLKKVKGKEVANGHLLAGITALLAQDAPSTADELSPQEEDEPTDPRDVGVDVARGTIDGVDVVGSHLKHEQAA